MTGSPFAEIGRGTVANDGTGDTPYVGAGKVNALIRAANAGQLGAFRNKIINGALAIWQRGTSFASGASQYTADRWKFRRGSNAAGATLSRQTGFSGARYCARVQRDNANSAADAVYFCQQIETADCYALAGKTVRITVDARAGANFSDTLLRAMVHTGTGADESVSESAGFTTGNVTTTPTGQAITTTAARITFPAVEIAASVTEIALVFFFNPTGTAGAADHFEITQVQFEIVDDDDETPTPFEIRTRAQEMPLCERYYEKSFVEATAPAQDVGVNTGEFVFPAPIAGANTERSPTIEFQTRKRTTPTITLYNPDTANAQVRDETASGDCSATATAGVTESGFRVTCTGNASTAVGGALGIHWVAAAEL